MLVDIVCSSLRKDSYVCSVAFCDDFDRVCTYSLPRFVLYYYSVSEQRISIVTLISHKECDAQDLVPPIGDSFVLIFALKKQS